MSTLTERIHIDNLHTFADEFIQSLHPIDGSATVIALHGDLGTGKTTFVSALAHTLGIADSVVSPTFVIMKSYAIRHTNYDYLVHVDAYRLESSAELERLRFREYLADSRNLICVEWPSIVPESIPESAVRIDISIVDEFTREFVITRPDSV
jgi:tRNA threonylcarbamoyladenosine biosynthesis protein TsaE